MRTENDIRQLYETWKQLKQELIECGDAVSLIVAKQSDYYISLFEWVLEIEG